MSAPTTTKKTTGVSVRGYDHLVARPETGRRQLFVKGRGNLTARMIVGQLYATGLTPSEVARSRHLPVEAVWECLRYYDAHKALVDAEVAADLREGERRLSPHPSSPEYQRRLAAREESASPEAEPPLRTVGQDPNSGAALG